MKKLVNYIIVFTFIFSFSLANVYAKEEPSTIADLRKEIQNLKNKKSANENKKQQTKSQIDSTKNKIQTNKKAIDDGKIQVEIAQKEIQELDIEINEALETIKKMINNYSISKGENVYLDFIFNSESYADLVYRYALITQIVGYNNEQVDSWQAKIQYNEQLQIDLAKKEEELSKQVEAFSKEVDNLGSKLSEISEITMDINDEINSTQELVNLYVKIGCGENEDLEECVRIKGDVKFTRPIGYGTITSYYGNRLHPTQKVWKFHSGVDMAGGGQGAKIYASANGFVGKIINATSSSPKCGGRQVYIFHTVNGKRYTTAYLHLLNINVKLGDFVTANTVVGTMGGGKGTRSWETCSTGTHLHFSIATGWYGCAQRGGDTPNCYVSYNKFLAYTVNPKDKKYLNLPNKGTYWFTR